MKIINLQDFRAMPKGTVYCNYQPQIFGQLKIKGETWDIDFTYASLIGYPICNDSNEHSEILYKAETEGISFDLDTECYGRDSMFEDNQLFAIYEEKDLIQLIGSLCGALNNTSPDLTAN